MHRRTATEEIIHDVSRDEYIELNVKTYSITEEVGSNTCSVSVEILSSCRLKDGNNTGYRCRVRGCIIQRLSDSLRPEYPSLGTITFTGFEVDATCGSSRKKELMRNVP